MRPPPTIPLAVIHRFFSHIENGGSGGCWIWTGYIDDKGYGQIKYRGRAVWAHRMAFELCKHLLGEGEVVHHKCHNPSCVNPVHLEATTAIENTAEATRRNRVIVFALEPGRSLFPVEDLCPDLDEEEIPF